MARSPDIQLCYQILEAQDGATFEEIKLCYRQLMKVWHPDRFSQDAEMKRVCEDKVKRITEAFRKLESMLKVEGAVPSGAPSVFEQARPAASQPLKLEPVFCGRRFGYADPQGYLRIPAVYEAAAPFSEGLAAVSRNSAFGYIDMAGTVVIDFRFSFADAFCEDRALVQYGRYGYINRSGEYTVQPKFEAGKRFQEGFAAVKADGKWGYVRHNGTWLIHPQLEDAQQFQHGRALARREGRPVAVHSNGELREV